MTSSLDFLLLLSGLLNAGLSSVLFFILWSRSPTLKSIFAAAVSLWPAPSIERCKNLILPLFIVLKWRWIPAAYIGDFEAAKEIADCENRPLDAGNYRDPENDQAVTRAFGI